MTASTNASPGTGSIRIAPSTRRSAINGITNTSAGGSAGTKMNEYPELIAASLIDVSIAAKKGFTANSGLLSECWSAIVIERPVASARALARGLYPSLSDTASTRRLVSSLTWRLLENTCDTVVIETPASSATWKMLADVVGLGGAAFCIDEVLTARWPDDSRHGGGIRDRRGRSTDEPAGS